MVLVTGGAGYVGSHTCIALADAGYDFVILDNFSQSCESVIHRIGLVTGNKVKFHKGDIADSKLVVDLLRTYGVKSVMHFAAFKSVAESVANPMKYYQNNVEKSLSLLRAVEQEGVGTFVFSSSCTVYGDAKTLPVSETSPIAPTNPYGWSKAMVERILFDLFVSRPDFWRIAALRYFNPVGAHQSGLIGEDPLGVPNNLMPYLTEVAAGKRSFLNVWGGDYLTPDGSAVRDYIHVMDLAEGHVAALGYLQNGGQQLFVNLGSGVGTSVLELVRAFERVTRKRISIKVGPRRNGDVEKCWADPQLAATLLGWRTKRDLDQMCSDAWRWQESSLPELDPPVTDAITNRHTVPTDKNPS